MVILNDYSMAKINSPSVKGGFPVVSLDNDKGEVILLVGTDYTVSITAHLSCIEAFYSKEYWDICRDLTKRNIAKILNDTDMVDSEKLKRISEYFEFCYRGEE
jgi:hypothetical protein